jgi:Ca2+-binding EF-hand superfamily protein
MSIERGGASGGASFGKPFNAHVEFSEFSRREVNDMKKTFTKYDQSGNGVL